MVNGAEGHQGEGTDSIAVGNRPFVEEVKAFLRFQAKGTETTKIGKGFQVREASARYKDFLGAEKRDIGPKNTYSWNPSL